MNDFRGIRDNRLRDLCQQALQSGWSYHTGPSAHFIFKSPTGSTVVVASSPGDHRSYQNTVRYFRRAGLPV